MTLPTYLDCKRNEIEHCEFYMHNDCPRTCGYARDIRGGVGAVCDGGLIKRLEKKAEEELI